MDVDAIQPIGPIAEWLGITHQTLYRWTKQGLPHFRIGSQGRRYTTPQQVTRWLHRHRLILDGYRPRPDLHQRLVHLADTLGRPTTVKCVDTSEKKE